MQTLTEFQEYLSDVAENKSICLKTIGAHANEISRQRRLISQEESKLHDIKIHLADVLMTQTKFPAVLDMYIRHKKGINPRIEAGVNPDVMPGRLCYEAACEGKNPLSGEALLVYNALREFGFPQHSLKGKLARGVDNSAVIGISFIKEKVLATVIDAMTARRLEYVNDTPEQVRKKIINGIIIEPKKQIVATTGNGITPRSGHLPRSGGNGSVGGDGQRARY